MTALPGAEDTPEIQELEDLLPLPIIDQRHLHHPQPQYFLPRSTIQALEDSSEYDGVQDISEVDNKLTKPFCGSLEQTKQTDTSERSGELDHSPETHGNLDTHTDTTSSIHNPAISLPAEGEEPAHSAEIHSNLISTHTEAESSIEEYLWQPANRGTPSLEEGSPNGAVLNAHDHLDLEEFDLFDESPLGGQETGGEGLPLYLLPPDFLQL